MAGHAKSHAILTRLQNIVGPLSFQTEGKSSREKRASASVLSSAMRATAVAKAKEEKDAKDAEARFRPALLRRR